MSREPDAPRDYASPPCFAHELEFSEYGRVAAAAPADVPSWRKAERERLISARLAVPAEQRERLSREIAGELDRLIDLGPGMVVSVYWPFRGEPDLRGWMRSLCRRGARVALPVVVEKGRPLVFREWLPGGRMERGVWNIPVPAAGAEVTPDIVLAPLVGFDSQCYRLGYGGGFYDRTLAARSPRPLTIGVGYPAGELRTIHPQPHDIPMDAIVTGAGRVRRRERGGCTRSG